MVPPHPCNHRNPDLHLCSRQSNPAGCRRPIRSFNTAVVAQAGFVDVGSSRRRDASPGSIIASQVRHHLLSAQHEGAIWLQRPGLPRAGFCHLETWQAGCRKPLIRREAFLCTLKTANKSGSTTLLPRPSHDSTVLVDGRQPIVCCSPSDSYVHPGAVSSHKVGRAGSAVVVLAASCLPELGGAADALRVLAVTK